MFFLVLDLFLNRKEEDSRDSVFSHPLPHPGSRATWGFKNNTNAQILRPRDSDILNLGFSDPVIYHALLVSLTLSK